MKFYWEIQGVGEYKNNISSQFILRFMKLQSIRTSENFEILVELNMGITENLSEVPLS